MTIALSIVVLIGLAVAALIVRTVQRALPLIAALRHEINAGRQPMTYRFRIAEPVRRALPLSVRGDRKLSLRLRLAGATAIKPAAKPRRPAAAAAA